MKTKINDFLIDIKGAFWHMLLSAMLFILVGYYLPKIYTEYFDTTDYYSVKLPIQIDKTAYYPCDTVKWIMERTSKVNIDAIATIELVLLRGNTEVDRQLIPIAAEKGTVFVSTIHKLPCNLDPGEYKYNGILAYEYKGVPRHYHFYTESFFVEATNSAGIK